MISLAHNISEEGLGNKLRNIRENALGLTLEELSPRVQVGTETIKKYENDVENPDFYLDAIRRLAEMEDVPLRKAEIELLKKNKLRLWHGFIQHGQMENAKKHYDRLAFCVKWAGDDNLQILFDILRIKYHLFSDEKDICDELVKSLKDREQNFNRPLSKLKKHSIRNCKCRQSE